MTKKQIQIFGTQSDIVTVIHEICVIRPLHFVVAGVLGSEKPIVLRDAAELLPLTSYLAFDVNDELVVRRVPQRKGGVMVTLDQMENPNTVVLSCGGLLDGKQLIAGQLGTATQSSRSEEIYALFSKTIRRHYERIKSYYVGPEAARLMDQGMRLTPTVGSSKDYDLVRQGGHSPR